MLNIKALGVRGDGVTDDAPAINAADARLSASGGGVLMFAPGVYIAGRPLIRNANVVWEGAGVGSTIIRQKAGTSLLSLVQTPSAYSLFGTASLAGPEAISFRDMCFDGNKAQGCHGDGIAIYAPLFNLSNIEITNCSGTGLRTEFGVPGAIGHGYCAQSNMSNCIVHDNDGCGVRWGGSADPSIVNCNIYRNLNYNLWLASPAGSGCKVVNCHVWGSTFDNRQAQTGIRVDSGGNLIVNTVAEGSTTHQIHLRSSGNNIVGGNLYYHSDGTQTFGVTLGDEGVPVSANTISTRIDNCRAGAIYFANSIGHNHIHVQGWNGGPSSGMQGAPAITDHVHIQIAGNEPVTNGLITHLAGMGMVSLGASNSGGSGYRALRVPN